MVAHGGLLGEERQIPDSLIGVFGVDHVVAHGGVHVQYDVYAPAVLCPCREVGIIYRGGAPKEGAVTRFAAERPTGGI